MRASWFAVTLSRRSVAATLATHLFNRLLDEHVRPHEEQLSVERARLSACVDSVRSTIGARSTLVGASAPWVGSRANASMPRAHREPAGSFHRPNRHCPPGRSLWKGLWITWWTDPFALWRRARSIRRLRTHPTRLSRPSRLEPSHASCDLGRPTAHVRAVARALRANGPGW